ncbi:hypothetical protein GCM10023067_01220 [Aminobacter aganoensis]
MDARVDAKLKTDIAIVTPDKSVRVDIRFGDGFRQSRILAQRAKAEAVAKTRNSSSSQLGNPFFEQSKTAVILHDEMVLDAKTGVPLFKPLAIDRLLTDIDRHLGLAPEQAIFYEAMKNLSMSELQRDAGQLGAP